MQTVEAILRDIQNVKVIDHSIEYNQYTPLDLSVYNDALLVLNDSSANDFEMYIENHLTRNKAKVAYGGYGEERNLYKRSSLFEGKDNEARNIHIGLDLWIKAGTPVLAALDGKVHSFKYNSAISDYGPTIIMEHPIENYIFYTLYGHLSLESIATLKLGDIFRKGQQLATLGDASVNGDYAPHLHFQIIKNIRNYFGDYPGVCSKKDFTYYSENCPDPNLLLKIV
jgi:murein DD-endopeptidase MepM/ murein hydrolase activator NlpD